MKWNLMAKLNGITTKYRNKLKPPKKVKKLSGYDIVVHQVRYTKPPTPNTHTHVPDNSNHSKANDLSRNVMEVSNIQPYCLILNNYIKT